MFYWSLSYCILVYKETIDIEPNIFMIKSSFVDQGYNLTLPMVRLHSFEAKGRKDFCKSLDSFR